MFDFPARRAVVLRVFTGCLVESPTDLEMKAAAAHRHGDLLLLEAACVRLV